MMARCISIIVILILLASCQSYVYRAEAANDGKKVVVYYVEDAEMDLITPLGFYITQIYYFPQPKLFVTKWREYICEPDHGGDLDCHELTPAYSGQ